MRTGIVNSSELHVTGRRLTGGFHLSEDEEAMRTLRKHRGPFLELAEVTKGRGVYTGGIFKIIPAADSAHGKPYVSAKDLVQSQVRPPGYISKGCNLWIALGCTV
jgi:hypothetical protein